MPENAVPNDAPTRPLDEAELDLALAPAPAWKTVVLGAVLGVMLASGLVALTKFVTAEGGQSFVYWMGWKVHDDLLVKRVNKYLERKYGEEKARDVSYNVKATVILGGASALGLVLGTALGLVTALARRRRSAVKSAAGPLLPAAVPLGLAVLGLFTNGFIWGNVAVLLLPCARKRRGAAVATWLIGAVAAIGWAWALEIVWG